MIPGITLIAQERKEQLEKHSHSILDDVKYNSTHDYPLTKAAAALTVDDLGNNLQKEFMKPSNWSQERWLKMMNKPYKERLVIAGALIAAEIDRVNTLEKLN